MTAVLFAMAGVVALARKWWWPWIVALVASLFVLDTRLVLGVHWFSDVTFGFVLGVGWGATVAVVSRWVDWQDLAVWLPGHRGGGRSTPGDPPEVH